MPSARHASPRPRTASESCQNASGRVGSPKLRQLVTPSGRAPGDRDVAGGLGDAHRRAAVRDPAPRRPRRSRSRRRGRAACPSRAGPRAPWPGPATVLVWTVRVVLLDDPAPVARCSASRAAPSRTRPGSIPRSGRSWPGAAGSPGAGAARRRAGGWATRRWTIASLVRAAPGSARARPARPPRRLPRR